MIIDCIADLHGNMPTLTGGDLLILAGDYTARDTIPQWVSFFQWLKRQDYRKKVVVAGNHDGFLMKAYPKCKEEADRLAEVQSFLDAQDMEGWEDFEYLCDSGIEFEGLKIWGTPWTPLFDGVNPACKSFMADDEFFLDQKFDLIPEGIDVLITHGPMLHILDANIDGYSCGSAALRRHMDRVKPRFHVFGHIHEQGGQALKYKHAGPNSLCMNCSYVNERYQPVNDCIRIEI